MNAEQTVLGCILRDNNVYRENYVVTKRHWYVNSTYTPDKVMWKETEIDSYGRPCITASLAVRGPEGNVVAVVAADVNFEQIMSNVIGSGLGETGTTFILGATRDLVAYSGFMKDVEAHGGMYNAFEDHFTDPETVRKKVNDCAFGKGEAFHAELDGNEIYSRKTDNPEFDGNELIDPETGVTVADVAASFQEAVVDALVSKTIAAAKDLGYKKIAIAGGVASNSALREGMRSACEKEGFELYYPKPLLCTDNAVMIGCAAYYEYISGTRHGYDLNAVPNLKLGER